MIMNTQKPMRDLRIVHYVDTHIVDPRGQTTLPWEEYQAARNKILEVCRRFGTIGPMDLYPLQEGLTKDDAHRLWKSSPLYDPDFFVVDDQLNDERYIYVEINGSAFSKEWIGDICDTLDEMRGWGVAVKNILNGYLILFPALLLVNGSVFQNCIDLECVTNICGKHLR